MAILMAEREVALLIGMSVHWLRRKRWEGKGIRYIKLENGAVRYLREDIEHYISKSVRKSTSENTVSQAA